MMGREGENVQQLTGQAGQEIWATPQEGPDIHMFLARGTRSEGMNMGESAT